MTSTHILFVAFAVIVLAGASLLVIFSLKKRLARKQLLGLQFLQALRFLLMHIQKHRGLSTSFLSGNPDVEGELIEIKTQISKDIQAVSSIGEWIALHEDWQGITSHWAKLGGGESASFAKNFSQHCKLIINVLALLDTVAEQHQLSQSVHRGLNSTHWHEFLWAGELIGQCRALGVRILGLREQNEQLEKHKKQISKALTDIRVLLDAPYTSSQISAHEVERIQSFVEFVHHHLIADAGIISSHEYFQQATSTISIVYECFDREMQKLHRKIAARS